MRQYSIEPRTRKYVKGYGFLSISRKCKKWVLDAELDAVETASKKKVHKTDEFFGNKSADAVLNSANDKIEKREPLEQIIIPLQERDKILNKSRQVLS